MLAVGVSPRSVLFYVGLSRFSGCTADLTFPEYARVPLAFVIKPKLHSDIPPRIVGRQRTERVDSL